MLRVFALTAAATVIAVCSSDAQVIRIWAGVAPGSEHWTQKERTVEHTSLGGVVLDVVTPTLTAYLPERAKSRARASSSRQAARSSHWQSTAKATTWRGGSAGEGSPRSC